MESSRSAIVMGGGIAGLTAAKALSEHFNKVTIIERDALPVGPEHRKGIPQGHQTHVLMPLGFACVNDLFPGFGASVQASGVEITDVVRDMVYWGPWGWRTRGPSNIRTINVRRPYLEHQIRERVRALANVEILQGSVEGLRHTEDRSRVIGVEYTGTDGLRHLDGDLVVDASGRGSKAAAWIVELGYEAPELLAVSTECGYSSQLLRFGEDRLAPDATILVSLPYPGHHRGTHLFRQEEGIWILTGLGMNADYPPRDAEGLLDFVADAWTPYIAEVARRGEPMSDVKTYRFPRNRRHQWHQLTRLPRGFIPIGDAIACFNPIYGQGMSVAAYEARALRDTLAAIGRDLDALPERFLAAAQPAIDWAFLSATTFDATYPDVVIEGEMDLASQEELIYIMQVDQLATADPSMHELFYRYLGGMEPEVFSDETRKRVADWVAQGQPPQHTDPMRPPGIGMREGLAPAT
jgi:2-polyprenyl-6-methoxyphenol hydroxylase-like FAD-dependent oxidoreductase